MQQDSRYNPVVDPHPFMYPPTHGPAKKFNNPDNSGTHITLNEHAAQGVGKPQKRQIKAKLSVCQNP